MSAWLDGHVNGITLVLLVLALILILTIPRKGN